MKTENQAKTTGGAARGRVILVGTHKGDQLKNWSGWYCWPLGKDDWKCCQCENVANNQSQLPIQSMAKLATGNNGIGNASTLAAIVTLPAIVV